VTPDWSLRTVRAAGFGAVCTLVSAAAHWFGGGSLVGPGGLAAAIALTSVGAFLLGGRERSMRVVLPAVLAAQYGLHVLFGQVAPEAPAIVDPDLPTMAQTEHSGLPMLIGHLIVALLTAAWLRCGEELFCSLVRRTAARILRLLRCVLVPSREVPGPVVTAAVRVLVPMSVVTVVGRRGPPAANSL
jgi:hypothetical protein